MNTSHESTINKLGRDDRLIALWEIGSVMISALLAEWAVSTFADGERLIVAIPVALALGLMLLSHRQRQESLVGLGFRFDNFFPALRLLLIPTVSAILLIVSSSWLIGDGLHFRAVRLRLAFVPAWALFQQYALQGYINRRAQMALGNGQASILLVALVFGILHLPSPLLSAMAFVGGFVWATVYQKHPNLFAGAISHTLVSWTLSLTIPASLTQHLRIGFKFFGFGI